MKKLLIAILFGATIYSSGLSNLLNSDLVVSTVYAEDKEIKLNIGEVAKNQGAVGTKNYNPEDGEAGFGRLMGQVLAAAVTISAILVFFYLLWGAFEWINSGGDKGKLEKAKGRIMQAILGLIVLAASIAIFLMIQSLLDFEVLTFTS